MATKSYSKHKEYKEYSSSRGVVPYTDEQFDMIKSDLIPKGSKLDSLGRTGGTREYHYEYKEEKLPSGKYDRKDLHTVEEFTIPPKSVPKAAESSSYYYEREERELPAISTGTRTYNYESSPTPAYSKVKSTKVTKEMTQNVDELDSLLDDLQKDQERQLYKSGYASDTAESTSFDFRRGTPAKAPSSGYSTLKHEERLERSSWDAPAPAAELRQEVYREEKTESRVVPAAGPAPAAPACTHCLHAPSTGTLPRAGTPMNKVTTTVKTYTYEVPAGLDPAALPLPCDHALDTSTSTTCQHCAHCASHRDYRLNYTTDEHTTSERIMYPQPANTAHVPHAPHTPHAPHAPHTPHAPLTTHAVHVPHEPQNGHGPYGPSSTYKYSETTYSAQNTHNAHNTHLYPAPSPSPLPLSLSPANARSPSPASPAPFPRPHTPAGGTQQPPKRLDDLLADFPEARFPTQPDGVTRRKVEVIHSQSAQDKEKDRTDGTLKHTPPVSSSKNVAGPAVYYPPGHVPFAKKDNPVGGGGGYQSAAMMQGGGAYASGRGMYEYESGARSREKHTEKKTAVPICLPLCCAMPCVIM